MAGDYNAEQEWQDFLASIGKTTEFDVLNPYQASGKLPGWGNLDPQALQTLGTYGVATSSNPPASAAYSFNALNQGLLANNPVGYRAMMGIFESDRQKNLSARMLGFEDANAAKTAGVQDTYGAYLEGILGDAEAMRQDTQRMDTIADQVEMGMLDFTSGDDWE